MIVRSRREPFEGGGWPLYKADGTGGAVNRLPLAGRRIVVTRAAHQAASLAKPLEARGAVPVLMPAVEIREPADPGPLERSLERLADFDWVVFASVHGVRAVLRRRSSLGAVKVAAVGPATARKLERYGITVSLVPAAEYSAAGLVTSLAQRGVRGQRILIPQAKEGRDDLAEGLARLGAEVVRVTAYETHPRPVEPALMRRTLDEGVDAVTFTSPSTVAGFALGLADQGGPGRLAVPAFCIGPTTAQAAQEWGFRVGKLPRRYEIEALVAVIVEHFAGSENLKKG